MGHAAHGTPCHTTYHPVLLPYRPPLSPIHRRESFKLKRGLYLATVTTKHGKLLRMFDVANVKHAFRVRVPELTRQELFSQLLHYHKSEQFFMLHGEWRRLRRRRRPTSTLSVMNAPTHSHRPASPHPSLHRTRLR